VLLPGADWCNASMVVIEANNGRVGWHPPLLSAASGLFYDLMSQIQPDLLSLQLCPETEHPMAVAGVQSNCAIVLHRTHLLAMLPFMLLWIAVSNVALSCCFQSSRCN